MIFFSSFGSRSLGVCIVLVRGSIFLSNYEALSFSFLCLFSYCTFSEGCIGHSFRGRTFALMFMSVSFLDFCTAHLCFVFRGYISFFLPFTSLFSFFQSVHQLFSRGSFFYPTLSKILDLLHVQLFFL